jgi:hypothetical protein
MSSYLTGSTGSQVGEQILCKVPFISIQWDRKLFRATGSRLAGLFGLQLAENWFSSLLELHWFIIIRTYGTFPRQHSAEDIAQENGTVICISVKET